MAIDIRVDEKACVGCSLCAEVCPTGVFEFNETSGVPEVKKQAECFGCLSCSEICPATAIDHGTPGLSESYYHDPAALALASGLGSPPRAYNVPISSEEPMLKAKTDLGIRLLSVAAVLKKTLGQSLASIGTQAGRQLAQQLPRYQPPATIEDALALAQSVFAPAWQLNISLQENQCTIRVAACFIRELCKNRGIELGGDLCTLFYGYLAGYIAKTAKVRPQLVKAERSDTACTYSLQLHTVTGG